MGKYFCVGRVLPFLFTLILTQILWASENQDKKGDFATKFKSPEEQIDQYIGNLPSLTGCDQKETTDEQYICIKDEVGKLSKDQIGGIEKTMKLKELKLIKSKNQQDVVGFITKKLKDKIFGKNTKEKDKALLSEYDIFTMHENQMTNTILLELGTFCRENVHIASYQIRKRGKTELDALNKRVAEEPNFAKKQTEGCMFAIYTICENYKNIKDNNKKEERKDDAQACLFKKRIAEMKVALEETARIKEEIEKSQANVGGFHMNDVWKEKKKFDSKKIDEVTTITSDYGTTKGFKNLKDTSEDFKKQCEQNSNSEECRKYLSLLSKEEYKKIQFNIDSKYELQKRAIELETDKEKLKEIAKTYTDKTDPQIIKEILKAI